VISGGKQIYFAAQQFIGYLRRYAKACGSILDISYTEINTAFLDNAVKFFD
jgi:hypothetical protein